MKFSFFVQFWNAMSFIFFSFLVKNTLFRRIKNAHFTENDKNNLLKLYCDTLKKEMCFELRWHIHCIQKSLKKKVKKRKREEEREKEKIQFMLQTKLVNTEYVPIYTPPPPPFKQIFDHSGTFRMLNVNTLR